MSPLAPLSQVLQGVFLAGPQGSGGMYYKVSGEGEASVEEGTPTGRDPGEARTMEDWSQGSQFLLFSQDCSLLLVPFLGSHPSTQILCLIFRSFPFSP